MPIILASTSPYRKQQLQQLGFSFDCVSPQVNEDHYKKLRLSPQQLSEFLAEEKATQVSKTFPQSIIIAGDQVIDFEGKAIGKPETAKKNMEQLLAFSEKAHQLISSVCVIKGVKKTLFTDVCRIQFKKLHPEPVKAYVEFSKSWDCAGGYKVENGALALIEKIDCQDPSAIMGLPLMRLSEVLKNYNVELFTHKP